jgi:glycosyltransferase involved in cell wall biosynthesis
MKILLMNTCDLEGGAARAAYRLHQGLQKNNITSKMLVQTQLSDDCNVIAPEKVLQKEINNIRIILEGLPLKLYPDRQRTNYSLQWVKDLTLPKIKEINPDLINIHWVNGGYLQIETIAKLKKPIVWTLHDMWAFTGGCHYTQDCDRYTNSCGACPQLKSQKDWDLSRWIWQRKAKAWKDLNLTIVTPSQWLANCARNSSLFANTRIEVIPNGLNTEIYKPIERNLAKNLLGLPQNKRIILFGAMWATSDRRKGFHLLQPAFQKLRQLTNSEDIELAIFGASSPSNPPDFGFPTHYLGRLNDDFSLSMLYAASDIYISTSLQDNLPNTIVEALACGTPCVAFKIGGMPDLIEHQQNGYLAEPFVAEDIARGMAWAIENSERYDRLCDRAREKAEREFNLQLQTSRYVSLFEELLN